MPMMDILHNCQAAYMSTTEYFVPNYLSTDKTCRCVQWWAAVIMLLILPLGYLQTLIKQ